MTNASTALKALLIYTAVLPVALLIGYLVATPTDFSSLAVIGFAILILSIPMLLKGHRVFLFVTWNTTAVAFFLPGAPQFWVLAALVSFGVVILQRALTHRTAFLQCGMVTAPILYLLSVVVITGFLTGGVGFRIFGSDVVGGKAYVWIVAAVLGYFAMISQQIPAEKAKLFAGLFFLGALSNSIGSFIDFVSPSLWYIFLVFPVDRLPGVNQQGMIARYVGLVAASTAAFYFLLATCSFREMFSKRKVFRLVLLFLAAGLVVGGGFRSAFIPIVITLCVVFYLEGLVKSGYGAIAAALGMLMAVGFIMFADRLPLPVQRSLSVLPLPVSEEARFEARNSSDYRIRMWKAVLPDVPRYLWLGKGIGIDSEALDQATRLRGLDDFESHVVTGAYHNGPLTTIIPFGIWGFLGWIWFVSACLRAMYLNYKYGDPGLRHVNRVLYAIFIARTLLFFAVFGEFRTDFPSFLGLIGLSLALNGGIAKPPSKGAKGIENLESGVSQFGQQRLLERGPEERPA